MARLPVYTVHISAMHYFDKAVATLSAYERRAEITVDNGFFFQSYDWVNRFEFERFISFLSLPCYHPRSTLRHK